MKKFLILGGHIGDSNGKPRFIAATQLIPLYGLNPEDCVCMDSCAMARGRDIKGLVILRPVASGDYQRALAEAMRRSA